MGFNDVLYEIANVTFFLGGGGCLQVLNWVNFCQGINVRSMISRSRKVLIYKSLTLGKVTKEYYFKMFHKKIVLFRSILQEYF